MTNFQEEIQKNQEDIQKMKEIQTNQEEIQIYLDLL